MGALFNSPGLFVLTISILTIAATGLFAAYLWRANRELSRRAAMPAANTFAQDIERMRHSRDTLAEAQRIGRMGSWEHDPANGAWRWSDETCRILEVDPAHFPPSYEAFLARVHPEDRAAVRQAHADSMSKPCCIDHRLLLAGGRIKHVRECCETCPAGNGRLLRGTLQDITALKQAESQLGEMLGQLRALFLDCESVAEKERSRIAWEMHEELGQLLAVIKMRIYGIHARMGSHASLLADDCGVIVGLIDQSIERVHRIVSELRPTVLLHGVAVTLEWLAADFERRSGIGCELEIGDGGGVASEELTTLVFRIVQELLDNIAHHGGVDRVLVAWAEDAAGYLLTVRCAGAGSMPEHSFSLLRIRERVQACGGRVRLCGTHETAEAIEIYLPASTPLSPS